MLVWIQLTRFIFAASVPFFSIWFCWIASLLISSVLAERSENFCCYLMLKLSFAQTIKCSSFTRFLSDSLILEEDLPVTKQLFLLGNSIRLNKPELVLIFRDHGFQTHVSSKQPAWLCAPKVPLTAFHPMRTIQQKKLTLVPMLDSRYSKKLQRLPLILIKIDIQNHFFLITYWLDIIHHGLN